VFPVTAGANTRSFAFGFHAVAALNVTLGPVRTSADCG
jgi:hypothetical protein